MFPSLPITTKLSSGLLESALLMSHFSLGVWCMLIVRGSEFCGAFVTNELQVLVRSVWFCCVVCRGEYECVPF